jgi:hypothetical protein
MTKSKTKHSTSSKSKTARKRTGGQQGSRAAAGGRAISACYGTEEHRIWRKIVDGKYKRSEQKGVGDVDSYVHRYDREIGFVIGSDSHDDSADHDARRREVDVRMRNVTHYPKSHKTRARFQGDFECFSLAAHGTLAYEKCPPFIQWLLNLKKCAPTQRMQFPPNWLIESYIVHLRDPTETGMSDAKLKDACIK